jgi:hypothetical protein
MIFERNGVLDDLIANAQIINFRNDKVRAFPERYWSLIGSDHVACVG